MNFFAIRNEAMVTTSMGTMTTSVAEHVTDHHITVLRREGDSSFVLNVGACLPKYKAPQKTVIAIRAAPVVTWIPVIKLPGVMQSEVKGRTGKSNPITDLDRP
jgi:hypothetical protein